MAISTRISTRDKVVLFTDSFALTQDMISNKVSFVFDTASPHHQISFIRTYKFYEFNERYVKAGKKHPKIKVQQMGAGGAVLFRTTKARMVMNNTKTDCHCIVSYMLISIKQAVSLVDLSSQNFLEIASSP